MTKGLRPLAAIALLTRLASSPRKGIRTSR